MDDVNGNVLALRPSLRRRDRRALVQHLAEEQGGVVSRAQLYEAGVSRGEVRHNLRAQRWQAIGRHCIAVHTGGHVNHSVFWNNLSPDGGDKPEGELAAAIDDAFGSFDAFRAQFSAAALGLQGSGWGFLAYEPIGGNLVIEQLYDQQGNVALGTTPLLMLDMWEHAFYLDYVNVKADYVKAFWNIVNWADVAKRFDAARTNATGLITLP